MANIIPGIEYQARYEKPWRTEMSEETAATAQWKGGWYAYTYANRVTRMWRKF